MNNHHKGLLAIHSAVFIFGFTALFSKLIDLPALDITMLRSIITFLALGSFILWQKQSLKLNSTKDYKIIIVIGLLLALHWVTYFHAMQVSTIAIGVISLYTFPVITVFLEPMFHGEKPHIKDIISALLVFIGIYLLVPEFSLDNQMTQGIVWGFISAFLFALRNILQGRYFKKYSAKQSLYYQSLITFIVLVPFSYEIVSEVTLNQWQQLFILGLFFTALPHTLFAFSLLELKAKTVSLIACVHVVYATTFAILLLNEWPEISAIIGGVIIVATAMYESYTVKSTPKIIDK